MADWDSAEAGYSAELMARAGAAAPATFGEIWNANWKATGLDTLTGSGQPLEDAFNKLIDAASARLGPIPQAARDAGLDWAGARGFEGKAHVIQQLVGALPVDQQKEIEPLLDFRARAAETAAQIEKDAGDINGRTYGLSGNATAWLAGVARQMVDPVNVGLLGVPGAGEAGLLASVGRQAVIAGIGQAAQEPIIQKNRDELGLESGFGQAAGDVGNVVGGTVALGLGLPLLFRGAAFLGRKAFARPEELPPMPAPVPSKPELLALPPPSAFPRYDHPLITPNYNAPLALPPPTIHPDIFAAGRDIMGRLEGEQGMALPTIDVRALHLLSEEAGLRARDQHLQNNIGAVPEGAEEAADRLARIQEVERQAAAAPPLERKALLDRRDELLADTTPDKLAELAGPLEQRRVVEAERASIADRLAAIGDERARVKAEQLGARTIALGERMPIRKVFPHDATLDAYQSVAPGDLEAAALVADRDVAAPHSADVDVAVTHVENGDGLAPRQMPAGVVAREPPAAPPERISDLPFPAEEKAPAPKPAEPPARPPAEGEAAPKPLGNPQLAADAERALADAGGDLRITLDDGAGNVREISARQALAEAEENAAAARELEQCLGGIAEEELP